MCNYPADIALSEVVISIRYTLTSPTNQSFARGTFLLLSTGAKTSKICSLLIQLQFPSLVYTKFFSCILKYETFWEWAKKWNFKARNFKGESQRNGITQWAVLLNNLGKNVLHYLLWLRNGVSSCLWSVSYVTLIVAISVSSVRGDIDVISDFSEENEACHNLRSLGN